MANELIVRRSVAATEGERPPRRLDPDEMGLPTPPDGPEARRGHHRPAENATRETTCTMVSEHARTGDDGLAWAP
jgi:hypothetical protein